VLGTFVASIATILLSCLPFYKYWQISPDPGSKCLCLQPSYASLANIYDPRCVPGCCIITNYLGHFRLEHRYGSIFDINTHPVTLGIDSANSKEGCIYHCSRCRHLRSGLCYSQEHFRPSGESPCNNDPTLHPVAEFPRLQDPINGAQLAGSWGTREAFVAVVTTNLPMTFPLFRSWLRPFFGSKFASTPKQYKTPNGFHTIGGGGTGGQSSSNMRSRSTRRPSDGHPMDDLSITESEEHMMEDIKMQGLSVYAGPSSSKQPTKGIEVVQVVEVRSADRTSEHTVQQPQRVHENW
jgi:hypothetical protein